MDILDGEGASRVKERGGGVSVAPGETFVQRGFRLLPEDLVTLARAPQSQFVVS